MQRFIYLLFTLSGFTGLIYEATWSRYLKLFLGHSSYGQILTLIIYMGGLGLGAFAGGKFSKKIKNPFYAYAIIEFLIGIGGLLYHSVYVFTTNIFYKVILGAGLPPLLSKTLKVVVSAIITLPEAILLGATFPCLAIGMMRLYRDNGKISLPSLYFFNSFGAALGIIVTSYYLISALGTPGTLMLAGIGNFIIAAGFYLISRKAEFAAGTEPNSANISEVSAKENFALNSPVLLWLIISGITGLSSFIYEIGWIRLLSLLLGSSTHSFDIMVSAFVFGLAFGGLYAKKLLNRSKNILYTIGLIQILMGSFATLTVYLYQPFFTVMNGANLIFQRTEESYIIFSVFKYLLSLALMFPTTFFAGMTLPVLTYIVLNKTGNEKYTGYIYGWNTIGSILGVILGGLVILPLFQLKSTLIIGAIIDIAAGLYIINQVNNKRSGNYLIAVFSVLLLLPAFFINFNSDILTAGQFRNYFIPDASVQTTIRDGKTATISFHQSEYFREIRTNGKSDAMMSVRPEFVSNSDEITMSSLALYPVNIMDKPYEAAIIGMGSGITANYLLADPQLKKLDIIEIEEEMYNLAKGFLPFNKRVYEDKRVNIIFEDAKTYFYSNNKKYDVIISEPSNPWVSGVSGLFTDEFYSHIKSFLNENGILVQWMHRYEFSSDLLLTITKAIANNFSVFKVYEPSAKDILIIASQKDFSPNNFKRLAGDKNIQNDLTRLGKDISYFGDLNYIVSNQTLKPIMDNYHPNSDFFPSVDNYAEKAFFLKNTVDLFEPFKSSVLYYQEITEPGFKDIIKWKDNNRKIPEDISSQLKYLDYLMKSPVSETNWQAIDQIFAKLVIPNYAFLPAWNQLPEIKLFETAILQGKVPKQFGQNFLLINYILKNNTAMVPLTINNMLNMPGTEAVEPVFIRAMLVYCLKNREIELYKKIISSLVTGNPNISPYEKTLLNSF